MEKLFKHKYLRGSDSSDRGLRELYEEQRNSPRVKKSADILANPNPHENYWVVSPDDVPFWTQSIQCHFVKIQAGGKSAGHAHQNEAVFYILGGKGYEIHDGKRYDWKKGDFVIVHPDSRHEHFNLLENKPSLAIVFKAKSIWVTLGLIQQTTYKGKYSEINYDDYESPIDWSLLWTPGDKMRKKVVRQEDQLWEKQRDGSEVKTISSIETKDLRIHSVDIYIQKILPGKSSAQHWHMADELIYVLEGSGLSVHREVEADVKSSYKALVRKKSDEWEIVSGDFLYIPPNTVHQHINNGSSPLLLMCVQNRIFKLIGYNSTININI